MPTPEKLKKIEPSIDVALRKIIVTSPHSQGNIEIQRAIYSLMIINGEMPTTFGELDYRDLRDRLFETNMRYLATKPHKFISAEVAVKDSEEIIEALESTINIANQFPPQPSEIHSHKLRALKMIIDKDLKYQAWNIFRRRPGRNPFRKAGNLWQDPSFSFIVTYGILKKPTGSEAIDSVYAALPDYVKDPEREKSFLKLLTLYNLRHPHSPVSFDPKDFSANLG